MTRKFTVVTEIVRERRVRVLVVEAESRWGAERAFWDTNPTPVAEYTLIDGKERVIASYIGDYTTPPDPTPF